MSHIFISYSHKDKNYAYKLHANLIERSFNTWIDDKRLEDGILWKTAIETGVRTCSVYLLIMSSNSKESRWVNNELELARSLDKVIYTLLLEGDGWWDLNHLEYRDVKNGALPPEEFFATLKKGNPDILIPIDGNKDVQSTILKSGSAADIHKAAKSKENFPNPKPVMPPEKSRRKLNALSIFGLIFTLTMVICVIMPIVMLGSVVNRIFATSTITKTSTLTSTSTVTQTPTITLTPTTTRTLTSTLTATITRTATFTLTPSLTPRPTNTPGSECPHAKRLKVGQQAKVDTFAVDFREAPGENSKWLHKLAKGRILDVIDGPVCADKIWWWKLHFNGTSEPPIPAFDAWAGEADYFKGSSIRTAYWLAPLP